MKRAATSALALALSLVLIGCGAGRDLHGTREDPPGAPVKDAVLLERGTGWVLTETRLAYTTDDGAKWHDLTPVDIPGGALRAARFTTDGDGWLVGESPRGSLRAYRFVDGAWRASSSTIAGSAAALDISGDSGWLLTSAEDGSHPALYTTSDSGVTWTRARDGVADPRALVRISATEAWARSADSIVRTTDGGESWKTVPDARSLPAVVDGAAVSVRADDGLRLTTTGGARRSGALSLAAAANELVSLRATGGFLVASSAERIVFADPCCARARDEGLPRPITLASFADRDHGWAVAGEPPMLHVTADGGATWKKLLA